MVATLSMIAPLALVSLLATSSTTMAAETIVVGNGSGQQGSFGWTDGVCYAPISHARSGDTLRFEFGNHDVWRLASRAHFDACDFTDAVFLAGPGSSPFEYRVGDVALVPEDVDDEEDDGAVYFACSIGGHCAQGTQKVQLRRQALGDATTVEDYAKPVSEVTLGLDGENCARVQQGDDFDDPSGMLGGMNRGGDSSCGEPQPGDDGRYHVSCLSSPATLTPGGVVNRMFELHYPYPKDERVLVGARVWEYVMPDPDHTNEDDREVAAASLRSDGTFPAAEEKYVPVPVNQLYVHHIVGALLMGQGNDGVRRTDIAAPFPPPYGLVTGDDNEYMIFHLIDLREVGAEEWLPCVECRCKDVTTGGIGCCTNCTDLEGPTIDYRLRYNVSYSHITDAAPVRELLLLTGDIAPALDLFIEFDVPWYPKLQEGLRAERDPTVQKLVREGPFNELFRVGDIVNTVVHTTNAWPPAANIKLFRCVGHLHIAGLGMWLEDTVTGERLCDGVTTYGTDPDRDEGLLTAIHVDSYAAPREFPADRVVRFVTEYNASSAHTGVMGFYTLYIDNGQEIGEGDARLNVEVCANPVCDTALLLNQATPADLANVDCEDTISTHAVCAAGMCDCDALIAYAGEQGCDKVFNQYGIELAVQDVCAKSCDRCSLDVEELVAARFVEHLAADLEEKCRFSTPRCREALNNAYSCGLAAPGLAESSFDEVMQRATVAHAGRLALEHAKLGSPLLRQGLEEEVAVVRACAAAVPDTEDAAKSAGPGPEITADSSANPSNRNGVFTSLLLFSALGLLFGCL